MLDHAGAAPPTVGGLDVWQIAAIISVIAVVVVALLTIRKYRANKKRARTLQ